MAPLANPTRLQILVLCRHEPARIRADAAQARSFSDYADLEAHYHKRPGLWVEPKGDWGKGTVTLVEIPADQEIYDNIVAYWRPMEPYTAGSRSICPTA